MFEIEAKVRLTRAQARDLRKKVVKMATFKKRSLKEDHYYACSSSSSLRLRTEDGKSFLHFKEREGKPGMETNEETEFPIDHMAKWDRLLRDNGFPLIGKKRKSSETYRFEGLSIELNEVKGLGPFLEIERLVERRSEIPKAKREVAALFKRLGFAPKDFERKLYLELLAEKAKNRKANI